MFENKIVTDFNDFVASLNEEKDAEIIQKWKQTPIQEEITNSKRKV